MTSIGETLRRERLRRNLAIDQISRELKISPKMLEAIESEEFDKLPGTIFAKNFVRQYAHMLGLDEDEMVAEVQRALQPSADVPRFAETGKQHVAPIQVAPIQLPRVEEWESASERSFSWSSPLPALALFVVAMLVCSGVYAWYQKSRRPVATQNSAATEPAPSTQAAPVVVQQPQSSPPATAPAQTAEQQPAAPAQVPAAPAQNPPAQTAVHSPPTQAGTPPVTPPAAPPPAPRRVDPSSGPATVRVQITAEEPSWVLVRCDGKYLFSGTMEANQTRTMEAASNMELRLGNAGGVSVVLNGKAIGAVGPKGQVRTVQFTSGGFQIVAAPKSVPLIDPL